MVAYGYMAYLIRASTPHRPRELFRLDSIGEQGEDLLTLLSQRFDELGTRFHANESRAEGFRKKNHAVRGRSIFVYLRRGPVGSLGETFDVESEESTETKQTTALLSELRAAIYIPRDSYFGFLFVERVGGRHLKDLIETRVVKDVSLSTSMKIGLEGFALSDDWRRELAGKQVLRITELLEPNDSGHDPSTMDETLVRVSIEGGGLSSRANDLRDRVVDIVDRRHSEYRALAKIAPLEVRRKVWAESKKRDGSIVKKRVDAPRSSFTVSDKAEWEALDTEIQNLKSGVSADQIREDLQQFLPINRDEYESQRLEVSFGADRPEKTFVVTSDRVPQLVYEYGKWLTDIEIERMWEASAIQFLRSLGVSLPSGWPLEAP